MTNIKIRHSIKYRYSKEQPNNNLSKIRRNEILLCSALYMISVYSVEISETTKLLNIVVENYTPIEVCKTVAVWWMLWQWVLDPLGLVSCLCIINVTLITVSDASCQSLYSWIVLLVNVTVVSNLKWRKRQCR